MRLVDAYQRIRQRRLEDDCRVIVRRIRPYCASRIGDAITAVQRKMANAGYEYNPLLLAAAFARAPDEPDSDDRAELLERRRRAFCSQLVADVLRTGAFIPEERAVRTFAPGDFAPGGSAEAELAARGFAMSDAVELNLAE